MGCGASLNLEPHAEAETGLNPLRRKISELKRRSQVKSGTLSSKELLAVGGGRGEDEISASGSKRMPESYDSDKEDDKASESNKKDRPESKEKGAGDEGEGEEEGGDLGFGDVPSSPSFREYYFNSVRNSSADSGRIEEGKEGEGKDSVKVRRNDSIDSREGSECKRTKKGRRFWALRKGPGAVGNRLSVRSCYNRPSTQDGSIHLHEKSV